MHIVLTQQTHQSRQWSVLDGLKKYRVTCYWSGGDLRMNWLVEVYVMVAHGTSHWRQIKGREVIGKVIEFSNASRSDAMSANQ